MRVKLLADTFLGIAALLVFQSCAENTMATEDTTATQKNISVLKKAASFSVPVAGNSFFTVKPSGASEVITSTNLGNWTNSATVISTYFRVSNTGTLNIGLKASVPSGTSVVKVTVGSTSKNITLTGSAYTDYTVGDFTVSTPG